MPTPHTLRAYSTHVPGSFTLSLQHPLFHSSPAGRTVPKLSGIPAFEMLSRKPKNTP